MEAQLKNLWNFIQGRTFALLSVPVMLLLIGHGSESRSSYCRFCGKLQNESTKKFFGLNYQNRHSIKTTEFSKIYSAKVNSHCTHDWRRWSRFWTQGFQGLLGAGVACGNFPSFLNGAGQEEEQVKHLRHLKDRKKVAIVLNRLRNKDGTKTSDYDILQAIAELDNLPSSAQQNEWWQRHRMLFLVNPNKKS